MTLDGFPMEVSITGEPTDISHPKSVFDRLQGVPAAKNVRSGLFGTAMGSDEGEEAPFAASRGGPSFSVSLSNDHSGRTKLIQPFNVTEPTGGHQNNRPRSSSNAGRFNQHDDRVVAEESGGRPFSARGSGRPQSGRGGNNNSSRGNGGAGAARGRGGAGGQGKPAAAPSANPKDLDADLDAYFAAK
jgi:hypothetical protein